MKISVIITTYNGARFIEEQLNSIRTQSVQPDEVIISDDCSKDNTIEIVQRYIDNHGLNTSWHVHINKKNKGYARNFLEGAMLTTGDVVFFCDQDDIWMKDRVKRMSEAMVNNEEINLLCSNLEPFYFEKDTRKWSKNILKEMKTDGSIEKCELTARYFHLKRSGCTMCIRKEFLEKIMPYWITGWPHDDFVWKMAVVSSSCAIFHFISLKRRMHSNNATVIRERTREWRIKQLHDYQQQYSSLLKFTEDFRLSVENRKVIFENIDSLETRVNVIERRYWWDWIILYLKYRHCYPRKKGLYLDLYLAVFKKYKGVN